MADGSFWADLSEDQAQAAAMVSELVAGSGLTLEGAPTAALGSRKDIDRPQAAVFAVLGRAGSGKTLLLARLAQALLAAGATQIGPDGVGVKAGKRAFAVVAPTNKATSVLRRRGVAAATIHRMIYTPVYDPDYEAIAEWLRGGGKGDPPVHEALTEAAQARALAFFQETRSLPGALAAAGMRGSAFITGWTRRDEAIDIGLVDESSMLDDKQLDDLRSIFKILILFGDPAQLAPVGQGGAMAFDKLPEDSRITLSRNHRQSEGNPIVDLAYALGDPELAFRDFEAMIAERAAQDDRIVVAPRADPERMARAPMLVWRNATRIRLIQAFRKAYGLADTALAPGEPLICDGAELPAKQAKKRIDLEQAGLVKGAQAFYLGPGKKPGFARLHIAGAEEPRMAAAVIIQIEKPEQDDPVIPIAARMGAAFLHGAACTIHKAQGSQWPEVQVFAPDLYAAAMSGRSESGVALWKRLAYVAVTRAEERLIWTTRYAIARPGAPLSADDL